MDFERNYLVKTFSKQLIIALKKKERAFFFFNDASAKH